MIYVVSNSDKAEMKAKIKGLIDKYGVNDDDKFADAFWHEIVEPGWSPTMTKMAYDQARYCGVPPGNQDVMEAIINAENEVMEEVFKELGLGKVSDYL